LEEPAANSYPAILPYSGEKTSGKSCQRGGGKTSLNRDFEDTILKMAEIKKLTSKYFPPDAVKEILMTAEMQCKIRGNNLPLDQALEEFRKKARVREAMDYLKT
jgi:hypothetical protein